MPNSETTRSGLPGTANEAVCHVLFPGKAAYYQAHKAEILAKRKAWYEAHKAEKAAYYQAHKAESAARCKARYEANKAGYAARDKAWRKANPDKTRAIHAKRRARKRGAFAEYVDPKLVYKRDRGRCHICGKKVHPKRWHLDHIIPLARGGEHSYRNVAVACPGCNLSKGTKAGAQLRLI